MRILPPGPPRPPMSPAQQLEQFRTFAVCAVGATDGTLPQIKSIFQGMLGLMPDLRARELEFANLEDFLDDEYARELIDYDSSDGPGTTNKGHAKKVYFVKPDPRFDNLINVIESANRAKEAMISRRKANNEAKNGQLPSDPTNEDKQNGQLPSGPTNEDKENGQLRSGPKNEDREKENTQSRSGPKNEDQEEEHAQSRSDPSTEDQEEKDSGPVRMSLAQRAMMASVKRTQRLRA